MNGTKDTWRHVLTNVDPVARRATCRTCGSVAVEWKPYKASKRGGRWVCSIGRRQQRHGSRSAKSRARRLPYCESCRVKPSSRAAVVLRIKAGITLCANCRVLFRTNPDLFLASLADAVRSKVTTTLPLADRRAGSASTDERTAT